MTRWVCGVREIREERGESRDSDVWLCLPMGRSIEGGGWGVPFVTVLAAAGCAVVPYRTVLSKIEHKDHII